MVTEMRIDGRRRCINSLNALAADRRQAEAWEIPWQQGIYGAGRQTVASVKDMLHQGRAGLGRRAFVSLAAGAAAMRWLPARAQQPMPVVGFLSSRASAESANDIAAFRHGLAEAGYVEGKNVAIEVRWAEGRFDRLPALAAELASAAPAVIAATGGEPSALAARAAAPGTPIVFAIGGDPVEAGLVATLNRPGGNL